MREALARIPFKQIERGARSESCDWQLPIHDELFFELLLPMVQELFAQKTCDEWMDLLVGAAIPAGPVNNMEHLFADPQILHRDMIAEVEHPTIGTLRLAGMPIKFSETPGVIRRPPPLCGQHTDELLAELLGFSADRIEELKSRGVIVAK